MLDRDEQLDKLLSELHLAIASDDEDKANKLLDILEEYYEQAN